MIDEDAVAKCYGCDHWFRLVATEEVSTMQPGGTSLVHHWCVGCLRDIENNTKEVIESVSEYPEGVPSWEQVDTESDDQG